ncbi:MAG: RNA methyltransferase [Firmicutes bacterium]|jgi:TrmH family RNA methyltransferase|nr:RNA methyltransferase [Bacillota bacterium]
MHRNTSLTNKIIREYNLLGSRKFRKKLGKIILEGSLLLDEAVKAGLVPETVLYTPGFKNAVVGRELLVRLKRTGSRLIEVPEKTFKAIAQTENPQGIGAIARKPVKPGPELLLSSSIYFLLILDGIQDPGNLGTIIRTAAAAFESGAGIILLPGTVELYNPKVLRASMGGAFSLPVFEVAGPEECLRMISKKSMQLIAADPGGTVPYYDLDLKQKKAVIIGNENRGISDLLLDSADIKAYIPLKGKIAALNAAMAASVFIFEHCRQLEKMV